VRRLLRPQSVGAIAFETISETVVVVRDCSEPSGVPPAIDDDDGITRSRRTVHISEFSFSLSLSLSLSPALPMALTSPIDAHIFFRPQRASYSSQFADSMIGSQPLNQLIDITIVGRRSMDRTLMRRREQ